MEFFAPGKARPLRESNLGRARWAGLKAVLVRHCPRALRRWLRFRVPKRRFGAGGPVLGDFCAFKPRALPCAGVGSKSRGECKNSLRFPNGHRVEKFAFPVDTWSSTGNPHTILVRKGQLRGVLKTISDGDRNPRRGRQKTGPKTAQTWIGAKIAKKRRKSRFRPPRSALLSRLLFDGDFEPHSDSKQTT